MIKIILLVFLLDIRENLFSINDDTINIYLDSLITIIDNPNPKNCIDEIILQLESFYLFK